MDSLWLKKSTVGEFKRIIMITKRNAEIMTVLQRSQSVGLLLYVLHELLFK